MNDLFRLLNIQFILQFYEWIYSRALDITYIIAITGWLHAISTPTSYQIVFDLAFCGDWAGNFWSTTSSACWRVWSLDLMNAKCNIVPLWPLLQRICCKQPHCLYWGLLAYQLPKGLSGFVGVSIPDCQIVGVRFEGMRFGRRAIAKRGGFIASNYDSGNFYS